jgi:hypothetical protein
MHRIDSLALLFNVCILCRHVRILCRNMSIQLCLDLIESVEEMVRFRKIRMDFSIHT